MAITHTTAARNALADQIDALCNAGAGNPNAQLVIMTSGDAEVATLEMANPAFGAATGGTITANTISDDTSATGGTAALFKVVDRAGTEVFRGTVATSGGDINLSSLNIGSGDTVSVTSLTYTAST